MNSVIKESLTDFEAYLMAFEQSCGELIPYHHDPDPKIALKERVAVLGITDSGEGHASETFRRFNKLAWSEASQKAFIDCLASLNPDLNIFYGYTKTKPMVIPITELGTLYKKYSAIYSGGCISPKEFRSIIGADKLPSNSEELDEKMEIAEDRVNDWRTATLIALSQRCSVLNRTPMRDADRTKLVLKYFKTSIDTHILRRMNTVFSLAIPHKVFSDPKVATAFVQENLSAQDQVTIDNYSRFTGSELSEEVQTLFALYLHVIRAVSLTDQNHSEDANSVLKWCYECYRTFVQSFHFSQLPFGTRMDVDTVETYKALSALDSVLSDNPSLVNALPRLPMFEVASESAYLRLGAQLLTGLSKLAPLAEQFTALFDTVSARDLPIMEFKETEFAANIADLAATMPTPVILQLMYATEWSSLFKTELFDPEPLTLDSLKAAWNNEADSVSADSVIAREAEKFEQLHNIKIDPRIEPFIYAQLKLHCLHFALNTVPYARYASLIPDYRSAYMGLSDAFKTGMEALFHSIRLNDQDVVEMTKADIEKALAANQFAKVAELAKSLPTEQDLKDDESNLISVFTDLATEINAVTDEFLPKVFEPESHETPDSVDSIDTLKSELERAELENQTIKEKLEALEESHALLETALDHANENLQALGSATYSTPSRPSESITNRELVSKVLQDKLSASDALHIFAQTFPHHEVLESAFLSAKTSNYQHGTKLLQALMLLGGEYAEALTSGQADATARECLGNWYRAQESETVQISQTLRKHREFVYKGQTVMFKKHLTLGAKRDPRTTIQVYFLWEKQHLVIGYCGEHLPTASN